MLEMIHFDFDPNQCDKKGQKNGDERINRQMTTARISTEIDLILIRIRSYRSEFPPSAGSPAYDLASTGSNSHGSAFELNFV